MRLILLTRFLLAVVACVILGAANDAFAQTQQLNKTLERKFPEGFCPIDSNFLGSFVTDTGIIQLTFVTRADFGTETFGQRLDDVSIIEAAEFAANSVEDDNCYFDGPPYIAVYTKPLVVGPKIPFYEPFDPLASECAWDETDGATILGGEILFTGTGAVSTSVIISGLTPGTPYVLYGNWSAFNFLLPDACLPPALCMEVTVDDLQAGCGPLPAETKTWGGVKALYNK